MELGNLEEKMDKLAVETDAMGSRSLKAVLVAGKVIRIEPVAKTSPYGQDSYDTTVQRPNGEMEKVNILSSLFEHNTDGLVGSQIVYASIHEHVHFLPSDGMWSEGMQVLHFVDGPRAGKTMRNEYGQK